MLKGMFLRVSWRAAAGCCLPPAPIAATTRLVAPADGVRL